MSPFSTYALPSVRVRPGDVEAIEIDRERLRYWLDRGAQPRPLDLARLDQEDEDEVPSPPKGGASVQDRIAAFVMLDGMVGKTQAEKPVRRVS